MHNTKLRWLKYLKRHLGLPTTRQVWIWWDIISIPQHDRNLQLKAINSLCAYTQLCTRFIPLVRSEAAWLSKYGNSADSALPSGTLQTCKLRRAHALSYVLVKVAHHDAQMQSVAGVV